MPINLKDLIGRSVYIEMRQYNPCLKLCFSLTIHGRLRGPNDEGNYIVTVGGDTSIIFNEACVDRVAGNKAEPHILIAPISILNGSRGDL